MRRRSQAPPSHSHSPSPSQSPSAGRRPTLAAASLALLLALAAQVAAFAPPARVSFSASCPFGRRARCVPPIRRHRPLRMSADADADADSDADSDPDSDPGRLLDSYLSQADLRSAVRTLRSNPALPVERPRFLAIFDAIVNRTSEAEENDPSQQMPPGQQYPRTSPSRSEMTDMYAALRDQGHLRVFGAADGRVEGRPLPAMGSTAVTPVLLEKVTGMDMESLTPRPTNAFLLGGVALALVEGMASLYFGISLNFLVLATVALAALDQVLVNGAVAETIVRTVLPEYRRKILRHEAGHFLCAYLMGCPVEGCVLSAWAALEDRRFGGRATSVSAGTSFFDRDLAEQMNGVRPLERSSIDRYTVVVMAGIAAEAVNFGRADGGAGDEQALVQFLSSVNPRGGGAKAWDANRIRTQARWGAMQATLLLKEYEASYEALVDALERGWDLGQCIYAIESAARENGEGPMTEPLGYVVDRGLYGEWTKDPPLGAEAEAAAAAAKVPIAVGAEEATVQEPMSGRDAKEELVDLRRAMEDRLKDIEEQLGKIDNPETK